jgi:uncharacterized protein (TIGR00730 family)
MNICVYCGSRPGNNPVYLETAKAFGRALVQRGHTLIYGGGGSGMMGAVADAVMEAGGKAIGVRPRFLMSAEISHGHLSEIHVVETMHERKLKMEQLSDAFVALPGGAGTLEEIFEQWTWAHLGIHPKPCAFLNVNGYYDPALLMIEKARDEGFTDRVYTDMLIFEETIEGIFKAFQNYTPPPSKIAPAQKHEAKA